MDINLELNYLEGVFQVCFSKGGRNIRISSNFCFKFPRSIENRNMSGSARKNMKFPENFGSQDDLKTLNGLQDPKEDCTLKSVVVPLSRTVYIYRRMHS